VKEEVGERPQSEEEEGFLVKLAERVAHLETDVDWIRDHLDRLEQELKSIDNRVWYILASVIIGVLITILGIVL